MVGLRRQIKEKLQSLSLTHAKNIFVILTYFVNNSAFENFVKIAHVRNYIFKVSTEPFGDIQFVANGLRKNLR